MASKKKLRRIDIEPSLISKSKKYALKKNEYSGFISGSNAVETVLRDALEGKK